MAREARGQGQARAEGPRGPENLPALSWDGKQAVVL